MHIKFVFVTVMGFFAYSTSLWRIEGDQCVLQTVRSAMPRLHGAYTVKRASDESHWRRLSCPLFRLRRVRPTATQRRSVRCQRLTNLLSTWLREEVRSRRIPRTQPQVLRLVSLQMYVLLHGFSIKRTNFVFAHNFDRLQQILMHFGVQHT